MFLELISKLFQGYTFNSFNFILISKFQRCCWWEMGSEYFQFWSHNTSIILDHAPIVYFDQRMGSLHAVHWLKSFFGILTSFSIAKKKRRESTKREKNARTKKKGFTSFKVLLLNAGWHPNAGRLLGKICIFLNLVVKRCQNTEKTEKTILTCEQHA